MPYNSRLYAAMNLYGSENFKITLIEDLIPEDELADKEKYYIAYFNSTDDNIGYNISPGGMGGSLFKGHKHSQYSKNIISEKLKNKPQSEAFIKKRSYARARLLQNLNTGEIVSIMDIKKGYFYFQNIIDYRVYKSNNIFYACLESPHNRRPALSLEACLDLKTKLEQCFKDRHAKTIIALKLGYNKVEAQEKRRLATKKLATIKKQKY